MDTTIILPDVFASLFDIADLTPDTGEGSIGHLRDSYAWTLRYDHMRCVEADDVQGSHDCTADALDTLRDWCKGRASASLGGGVSA